MRKLLIIAFALTVTVFTSCNKDEDYAPPTVSNPTAVDVETDATQEITFSYTSEAGFQSSSITVTGGVATISTDGVSSSGSGTIVVSFTAGTTAGAGSVVLTVRDNDGQTGTGTAVVNIVEEQIVFNVTGNITSNTTWMTGKVYVLTSRISVVSGVTLTIQPGVIVKGQAGTGANATALLIARGGKLMAEGTASSPIIFTSVADEIMPGEIASPNLDPTLSGLWGGLLILGNAPISADAEAVQIEGIPPSDANGLYGGTNPSDNSGVIKYISIRHGGANIGEGNEINGLTLGGVGSGTVIDYIEIVANQDDGIEWFGGKVNVTNAVIWNVEDDAVDTDQSWGGTLNNFVVINPGDECFELDGPEGAMEDRHTLMNGTAYAHNAQGLVDLDDNSIVTMTNIYFTNVKAGQDFDLNPPGLTASNLQATLPEGAVVSDYFLDGSAAYVTVVANGANTVGADLTKFQNWSWAAVSGAFGK